MKTCRCGAVKRNVEIACKQCWRRVPAELRQAAWKAYRAKPYDRNQHLTAVMACLRHLAKLEPTAKK